MSHAILYSFRRCPYAMRARLAITISGIQVELREVVLRDKPDALLEVSPKATVPVLITADGEIIDESVDIVQWALQQSDPDNWLQDSANEISTSNRTLIDNNDGDFKHWLDRYKYADRFPEYSELYYRQQGEKTVGHLELMLTKQDYLFGNQLSVADIAVLPFIRQFAFVDKDWFNQSNYTNVKKWLEQFIDSALFNSIMAKYPQWQPEHDKQLFPE